MFDNLMHEVEYLQKARPEYGILEAIMYIQEHQENFPSETRRELREFLRQGQKMFA